MTLLGLEIHGPSRHVRLADDAAAGVVRSLFPRYVVPPCAEAGEAEPDLTVEAGPEGYHVGQGGLVTSVGRGELAIHLEHAVTLLLLEAVHDRIHLHAAGLGTRGGAVLALGASGTGKSSIAAAWCGAGHPVLGDDVVLVDPDLTAQPFHKPLKVDTARARAAGMTPESTLYWHTGATEVWYDPQVAGGWAPASRPAVLAFLERRARGTTELGRLSPVDAARGLLGQLLVTSGRPAAWQDTLFDLAEATPAYRVTFSDSLDAARALAALGEPR